MVIYIYIKVGGFMAKTIKKLAALAVALMICVSAMSVGVFALDTPSLTDRKSVV